MDDKKPSYRAWLRWREHENKRPYLSRKIAKQAAKAAALRYQEHKNQWDAYQCSFCNMWHIGHSKPKPEGNE